MLFAGVDGGQSGSRAVLADENGAIAARVAGPPLVASGDPGAVSAGLSALLRRARFEAGAAGVDPLRALVAGLSGQDVQELLQREAVGAVSARLVHDTEIAHAGALAGSHGIVLIAGSGSVAFGTDAMGRRVRHGGWGSTFGDEGSALWIGRHAVAAAMRAQDEAIPTRLAVEACGFFGVPTLRALQHAVRRGTVAQDLGGFAPAVLALADEQDAVATGVRRAAVRALCDLVVAVDRALEPQLGRSVSYAGSVFETPTFRRAWREEVESALEGAHVHTPRAQPVIGAAMLAFADAGIAAPAALLESARE